LFVFWLGLASVCDGLPCWIFFFGHSALALNIFLMNLSLFFIMFILDWFAQLIFLCFYKSDIKYLHFFFLMPCHFFLNFSSLLFMTIIFFFLFLSVLSPPYFWILTSLFLAFLYFLPLSYFLFFSFMYFCCLFFLLA
jgi:hypothetical protein